MQHVEVFKIPTRGPADLSGFSALIESGRIDPADLVAVIGKTEGNGCVNDFTRELAVSALAHSLGKTLRTDAAEVERRIAFVMSGGTEGVLSPHLTVFTRRRNAPAAATSGKRLAIGVAFTRAFLPVEIGRMPQARETAEAVRVAMRDAGIDDCADVHFVQVKCPLLTSEKVEAARRAGTAPVTADTLESMAYSRGASALGVALAMGEVAHQALADEQILANWAHYSSVASISAGIELENNVVILMGMSAQAVSPYRIAHSVMRDAIDAEAVCAGLASLGLDRTSAPEAVVNVFAKAEASPDGRVRGARHTMLNDSDISSTRHARAVVSAVIASIVGQTAVYVSGGAEHQGPPGGGPVAVIARA